MEEKLDLRKKIEHAFLCEKVQVTAQFEAFCHSVHLKWLRDELNTNEETHQCANNAPDKVYSHFCPNCQRGARLRRAEWKINHLNGKHYMVRKTVNGLLCSAHNRRPCFTYPWIDSECWRKHKKLDLWRLRYRTTWGGHWGWTSIDCTMPTHGGSSPLYQSMSFSRFTRAEHEISQSAAPIKTQLTHVKKVWSIPSSKCPWAEWA